MSGTQHGSFTFSDFRLQSGEVLPQVTIAYCTRGRLAADGRNAVLVTHGYTSGHRMIESGGGSSEGSWSELVGPGAPMDTERNFVVCCNMLGSSYGSTNAAARDPRTGRPYGSRFPHITVADIVTAQRYLLRHLGVQHLRAVVGPSYGGFQAFQWAVTFPDDMDGVVSVVSSPRAEPRSRRLAAGALQAQSELARRRLLRHTRDVRQPAGTAHRDAEGIRHGCIGCRGRAHRCGMGQGVRCEFAADPRPRHGGVRCDARPAAHPRAAAVYVLSRTDALFPPGLAPEVMDLLQKAGVAATLFRDRQ